MWKYIYFYIYFDSRSFWGCKQATGTQTDFKLFFEFFFKNDVIFAIRLAKNKKKEQHYSLKSKND